MNTKKKALQKIKLKRENDMTGTFWTTLKIPNSNANPRTDLLVCLKEDNKNVIPLCRNNDFDGGFG